MAISLSSIVPSTYNAWLIDYEIGCCDFGDTYFAPPNAVFPIGLSSAVGSRDIAMTFEFNEATAEDSVARSSELTAAFIAGGVVSIPDGWSYYVVLKNASSDKMVTPWTVQKTFNLRGARIGTCVDETDITATKDITVVGTMPTEPVITVVKETTATASILGITLNSIDGTIVIDCMKKTVMKEGSNVFANVVMTSFPKLTAGVNNIVVSGSMTAEISYLPVYM